MSSAKDSPTSIPVLDINRTNADLREEFLAEVAKIYDTGRFLHGPPVGELESEIARRCQVPHAVSCASGSDALLLALMALEVGPGDEVIAPSFTFFATVSCAYRLGARIVFADIDPKTFNIDPTEVAAKITSRTRAIIPVHLFGQPAQMDEISRIATRHDIPVVEDAAQALGAAYHGRPVCSWGQIGCISFYPTKNLGGFGDGGMLTATADKLAARLRLLANHGMQPRYYHSVVGINSRLDSIQAAGLLIKLRQLDAYTAERQAIAKRYTEMIRAAGLDADGRLFLPYRDPAAFHVWNQFSLRIADGKRTALQNYLREHGIGCETYYPVPLHLQKCFRNLNCPRGSLPHTEQACEEVLQLPIFPGLTVAEQERVVAMVVRFYERASARTAA